MRIGGRTFDLGRRATFDTAERELAKIRPMRPRRVTEPNYWRVAAFAACGIAYLAAWALLIAFAAQ